MIAIEALMGIDTRLLLNVPHALPLELVLEELELRFGPDLAAIHAS